MTLGSVSLLVFVFLYVCLIYTFLLGLFVCLLVCFDKVVTLALIFFINGRKWKSLIPLESKTTKCWTFSLTSFLFHKKIATSNSLTIIIALSVQNKKVYTCIIFQELWLKAINFSDIDECARNLSCHVNLNCTNTIGSHVCTCLTGYTWDGRTCSGDFNNFPSIPAIQSEK